MKYPKIKIDPKEMDYIEKGAGNRTSLVIAISILLLSLMFIGTLFGQNLTIDETKKLLGGNPYKIAKWMSIYIKTDEDSSGFAQPPERLFKYRKADCEDFALLAEYFLKEKYEETYIIVWFGKFREDSRYYRQMRGRKIAHAVVAVKIYENTWGIIDQDRFIYHARTLAEIIKVNGDLRRVAISRAYIADLYRYRHKVIKEIDLEG